METAGRVPEEPTGGYPPYAEGLPTGVIRQGSYSVHYARSWAEVDSVLRLRYRVFNLEMGEGLVTSEATGRDEDAFDAACHHLVVEHEPSRTVVGTYRIQSASMAEGGAGFYSAGEYDLSAIPTEIMAECVEVGRACIAEEHRNRQVLFLLWKGLARYMSVNRKRYLFGCCSLTSQDPIEGLTTLEYLERRGYLHPTVSVPALPELACESDGPLGDPDAVELPTLFRTYLRYRAKVVSPPAIDREFKTIDFLVLFDVEAMDPRSHRIFFDGC